LLIKTAEEAKVKLVFDADDGLAGVAMSQINSVE
jgi:hypothetical protein